MQNKIKKNYFQRKTAVISLKGYNFFKKTEQMPFSHHIFLKPDFPAIRKVFFACF